MSIGRIAGKLASKLIRKRSKPKKTITPADSGRKAEGKNIADLTQPAGGSAGRTIDQADAGIPSSKKAAKSATDFDKTIKATKEKLDIQKDTLKKLQKSLKAYGKGKNLPLRKRIKELKEKIELNQAKLTGPKGMVSRGGPRVNRKTGGQVVKKYKEGKQVASAAWMENLSQKQIDEILGKPTRDASGVKRHTKRKKINKPKKKKVCIQTAKTGGKVVKKATGCKMSHVGLSPAEESRSGTMSEAKRKKYKHGGKIHHNTSRENRLEELGRVDAEKAYTPQGKRNLKDEKKRIVRGLKKGGPVTGDDFVAQYYEISTDT